jgi:thiamine-phosphate pyrophosphorylase
MRSRWFRNQRRSRIDPSHPFQPGRLGFRTFVLLICFGFRASDLGFPNPLTPLTGSKDELMRQTAAAGRVLARAGEIAKRRGAAAVEPADLLAALLADESRGAELLAKFEVHFDDAETRALCDPPDEEESDPFTPTPSESDDYLDALAAAQQEAALAGRAAELGSEHLAVGLAAAPSAVRDLLASRGATPAELRRLGGGGERAAEPIATDFVLDPNATAFDRRHLLRAIDAAANRASEGLRVAEDYARFVRDDAHLTGRLKRLRHGITEALRDVPLPERLAARDTRGDVGTDIASPSAATRGEGDLLAANLHRAEEGLRSLEEFGRLLDPRLGPAFERLRYELYTFEKLLSVAASAQERLAGRDLYVLLTVSPCLLPAEEVIRSAAAGGAGVFQVREKGMRDRDLLAHLRAVRRWTREADALLIVNDRPDLAVLCGADGVHVGQEELTAREARRIVGPDRLVGVSTHEIEQARAAVLDGADYLGVGPVFPSKTKSFDAFAGLEFVRAVAGEIGLPWYAIGGVGPENVTEVRAAGATRVAVSSAVCAAEDPRAVAAGLTAVLRG